MPPRVLPCPRQRGGTFKDKKMSDKATAIKLVEEFFGDKQKAGIWFGEFNPLLGGLSPNEMIKAGRVKKLLEFIETKIDENNGGHNG